MRIRLSPNPRGAVEMDRSTFALVATLNLNVSIQQSIQQEHEPALIELRFSLFLSERYFDLKTKKPPAAMPGAAKEIAI
jgi:hypothetical protein